MAEVMVIGAGLVGLSTAMLLALDGHTVTVVERDPADPPAEPDPAWDTWERRGVDQFRMLHFMLPRWRELIEKELPEVVSGLEARGALRWNFLEALPAELVGGPQAGDRQREALTGRRPLVEAALATTAVRTYGLTVRRGVAVEGLVTGSPRVGGVGGVGAIPHVVGVRTAGGGELRADLVVDSGGRRSALPGWLAGIGARPIVEEREDCGFVVYGRHFRSADGSLPAALALPFQPYDSLSILALPADNGTWGIGFVTSGRDRGLHALGDPDRWHAALDRYPLVRHWADAEPISGVDVMTGNEDRYRRFVVGGEPVVTGIVAVGDAWAWTNPSPGRGAAIGLLHACRLRDLLREVPPLEPYRLATRWDEVTESAIGPLYRRTLAEDRHRLAEIECQCAGRSYGTDDPAWAIGKALGRAAYADPDALRWYGSVLDLEASPDEVLAVPGRRERLVELGSDGSASGLEGPDRAELLATVNGR